MPQSSRIMVIRHGEKPGDPIDAPGLDAKGNPDPQSLTAQGWRRAEALISLFNPAPPAALRSGLAVPALLIATAISDPDSSKRPVETLTPLSQSLHLDIDASIKSAHVGDVRDVATSAGGPVLIAWKHEDIPAIAQALTKDAVPAKWPKECFDVVWVFDLNPNGSYSFSQLPQLLLPGDRDQTIPL